MPLALSLPGLQQVFAGGRPRRAPILGDVVATAPRCYQNLYYQFYANVPGKLKGCNCLEWRSYFDGMKSVVLLMDEISTLG
jgi:hypothetical protein